MESDRESQALVPAESRPLKSVAGHAGIVVPRVIAEAGDQAARRFLEFFAATIRNKNTRKAYYHAIVRFFAWCDQHKIGEIADIEPLHVAAYIEALGKDFEKPTVKQHLAAIRMLFDWLVTGQIVATNPAHAVRGPKHVVKTGKTTVLTGEQARELLDSIDTSTLVGLRDRALISVMTFAFARIGAVVGMRVEGERHHRNQRPVAQPTTVDVSMLSRSSRASSPVSTVVLPVLTTCFGPRTA